MSPELRPSDVLDEVVSFLLALSCAGCGAVGAMLCDSCSAALAPDPTRFVTPQGLLVRAALRFESIPARCIRRLKGYGDTGIARPLGDAVAATLAEAVREASGRSPVNATRIVTVPTSAAAYRRRGYRVPETLVRRAGAVPWRVLRTGGVLRDQRGLGVEQRADNVRGSMRAARVGRGKHVVLFDDVLTTGATLDEAARALASAGFDVVSAVVLAATPRHNGRKENS